MLKVCQWAKVDENVYCVEELVLNQEALPGTHQTARQMAQETEIPRLTMFHIMTSTRT